MRESKGSACRVGRESGHLFKVGWPDAAIPQGGGGGTGKVGEGVEVITN